VILVDTDVLIDLDRYSIDPGQRYAASVLSRAELELGVHRAPNQVEYQLRRARLTVLDDTFDWLPFDRAASTGYGVVAGAASVTGARLRNKDALLAGQAYSLGLAVLTRNIDDFAPFTAYVQVLPAQPVSAGE